MAEKEERILITTRHKNEKLNMTFTDMYKEYTRQEAIEKMAKALFNFQYDGGLSFEYAYDGAKKEFRLFAEAALNALLEGKCTGLIYLLLYCGIYSHIRRGCYTLHSTRK